MKAQRQFLEVKQIMKTVSRMTDQVTTDTLSAYMGAALKEVELSRHLTFGQRATLNRLIQDIYRKLRAEAIDTDAVIEHVEPMGILELLFGT